jgi:nucleoid-associated protein YgaU
MTRETKIGLLVGLAFIIVIGILLSDHINTSTEPPPAAWAAYGSAQTSVGSPDARNQGNVTVVPPPAPVIPQDRVLTQHDPVPQTDDGSAKVSIGFGGNPSAIRTPFRPVDPPSDSHVQIYPPQTRDEVATNNAGGDAATAGTDFTGPLNNLVQQNAGELQPLRPPVGVLNPPPALPNPAAGHQVKAEEGDTVTKLAVKYMGGNSKANREAIIKANPSMTADGHLVFAGRTYTIPPTAAAQVPVSGAVGNAGQPAPRPVAEPATPRLAPGTSLYTVKDNDSLWKIASEQLGSGTRWQELRDLNADVLKGSEQVRVNMRLKLPAKSVASTN